MSAGRYIPRLEPHPPSHRSDERRCSACRCTIRRHVYGYCIVCERNCSGTDWLACSPDDNERLALPYDEPGEAG